MIPERLAAYAEWIFDQYGPYADACDVVDQQGGFFISAQELTDEEVEMILDHISHINEVDNNCE
jgi:hypothetical protein